jgi:hypothetical protein
VLPATPPVRGVAERGAPDEACTGAGAELLDDRADGAAPDDCCGVAHPVSAAMLTATAVAAYARTSMLRFEVGSTAAV